MSRPALVDPGVGRECTSQWSGSCQRARRVPRGRVEWALVARGAARQALRAGACSGWPRAPTQRLRLRSPSGSLRRSRGRQRVATEPPTQRLRLRSPRGSLRRYPVRDNAVKGSTGSPAPGRTSMCTCGPVTWPVAADRADDLAARGPLADGDGERRLVAVPELGAVLEGDHGLVAVGAVVADRGHDAVGDRVDRGAAGGGEVEAGVAVRPEARAVAEAGGQVVDAGR